MATPHVWHQLHLYRAKITRLGLLAGLAALALPLTAQAQRKSLSSAKRGRNGQVKSVTVENLPGYDSRWLHLGLYVAPNFSRYKIEQAPGYPAQGVAANSIVSPGFSVGFLGDVRLADHLSLTFTPGVAFNTRRIEFEEFGSRQPGIQYPESVETQEIGTTQLDLPVLLKLKSERRRNTRVYIVGGVNPNFTLGTRRNDEQANVLRAGTADVALEYGVGLDLFYPYFKFSPELRFSHGLTNLHQPGTNDVYTRSLQSMKSNTVTLYLNIWSGR